MPEPLHQMCTHACLEFARTHLREEEVRGRTVIEVGALDVNGSVRGIVTAHRPATYLGVDVQPGPGVDVICDATNLVERFGAETFDLLISTELLEHVRDWRTVVSQFKRVLKPGGLLLATTRSRGFPYHAYPSDFWRYEPADIRAIFSDFEIHTIESDPVNPGVLFKARKPTAFTENDTSACELFSMITERRDRDMSDAEIAAFHRRRRRRDLLRAPEKLVRRLRDRVVRNLIGRR